MASQAWMVRAGSHGEREEATRRDERAYVGWAHLGDLTHVETIEDMRAAVDECYAGESVQTLGNWAGQLFRFCVEMSKGDIIVTPLKSLPNQLLIGRVVSEYRFDAEADVEFQHYREVRWNSKLLDRDALRHDLRASIGTLLTVAKLERNDAFARLEKLSNGAARDTYGPTGDYSTLDDLASALNDQGEPREMQIPVHELLYLAGMQRRTAGTLASLEERLATSGLVVSENISNLALEDPIVIRRVETRLTASASSAPPAELRAARRAIGYRVSAIPSATNRPIFVSSSDSIELALTRMLRDNFSQLPVLDDGAVKGVVTWESIALAKIHSRLVTVADAIQPSPHIVSLDADLLDVVELVNSRGFILVSGEEGSIGGIVTVDDLVREFGRDRYPLVLLEELELRLRHGVMQSCDDADIEKSAANGKSFSDVTMGSYRFLLEDDTIWGKLSWRGVDRVTLVNLIERCRSIRNDLMHYSPDPIDDAAMADIEGALRVVRTLTPDL